MTRPLDDAAEVLAVQYVLGELRPDEAVAFERRLATEEALAVEVGRLRRTLGALPFATETEPPPGLRERIVAAAEAQGRRPARARGPRRIVWSRFAAAAAAALALAFGLDSYRVRRELTLQRELAATLLEPNVVQSFALAGLGRAGGAYGTVALDMDAKKGAVVLKGLPALAAGQVYRLWAKVGDKDVPCGDFGVRPDGQVLAQFVVPVESYTAPLGRLFVTVEPSGQGAAPSGPTVMQSV
jgi:anti-sigma-K factor RskA